MTEDLYTPLLSNDFRLLTILPGIEDGPVCCKLATANLTDSDLHYEAISYVWGDQSLRGSIVVNGVTQDVTANAAAALRTFRQASQDRSVFIDAVCINQHDLEERSSQVTLMADIYRYGQSTIVFLGEDSEKGEGAFIAVEEVARESDAETKQQGKSLEKICFPEGKSWNYSSSPLRCSPHYEALAWLYSHKWFTRVWVIQEVLLARQCSVRLGSASIALERILAATLWLSHKWHHLDEVGQSIPASRGFRGAVNMWLSSLLCQKTVTTPWHGLLGQAPFGDCTDLRDQVFGLFGLYQQLAGDRSIPESLKPDYARSVTDVLRDATRYAMREAKNLAVLELRPPGGENELPGLPTWVTSWYRRRLVTDPVNLPTNYTACGVTNQRKFTSLISTENAHALALNGLHLDCVHEITSVIFEGGYVELDHLHRIAEIAQNASASIEALGMTLIAGRWNTGASATSAQACIWLEYSRLVDSIGTKVERNMTSSHDASRNVASFQTAFLLARPAHMRSGDALVILQGGHLPFILRQQQVEDVFTFMGPAYVHGIMHGEAIEQHMNFNDDMNSDELLPPWRMEPKPREMIFNIV